jgi:hypothetical protein
MSSNQLGRSLGLPVHSARRSARRGECSRASRNLGALSPRQSHPRSVFLTQARFERLWAATSCSIRQVLGLPHEVLDLTTGGVARKPPLANLQELLGSAARARGSKSTACRQRRINWSGGASPDTDEISLYPRKGPFPASPDRCP